MKFLHVLYIVCKLKLDASHVPHLGAKTSYGIVEPGSGGHAILSCDMAVA